jgi:hypothetical protein
MDVLLSSDDDDAAHPPEPNAPATLKASPVDDAKVVGTASAETPIPGLIGDDVPKLPATDQVTTVPSAKGHGQKRPPIAARRPKPAPLVDQVMFQVEIPPFHGFRNPLELVAIEIVYGHIFEAFRRLS